MASHLREDDPVTDPARYYDLEGYLFGEVSARSRSTGQLSAFDFFCIVIGKANRAKSKVAKRLPGRGCADLPMAVQALTRSVASAQSHKARLRGLVEDWGFRLPMASAILAVPYPDDFTVYDVRVCDVLDDFQDARNRTRFEDLWARYAAYAKRVQASVPDAATLRDRDRHLRDKSFRAPLEGDSEGAFGVATDDREREA